MSTLLGSIDYDGLFTLLQLGYLEFSQTLDHCFLTIPLRGKDLDSVCAPVEPNGNGDLAAVPYPFGLNPDPYQFLYADDSPMKTLCKSLNISFRTDPISHPSLVLSDNDICVMNKVIKILSDYQNLHELYISLIDVETERCSNDRVKKFCKPDDSKTQSCSGILPSKYILNTLEICSLKKLRIHIQKCFPFNIEFTSFLTPRLNHIDSSVSYYYFDDLFEDAGLSKILSKKHFLHHLANGLCAPLLVHESEKSASNTISENTSNSRSSGSMSKKHIFTYNTPNSDFSRPEVTYKYHFKEISQEEFDKFCDVAITDDSVSAHYTKRDFENSQSYTIDIYNNQQSSQSFKVDPSHVRIQIYKCDIPEFRAYGRHTSEYILRFH